MVKETILSVNTAPAVKSIGELRQNISALKKQLNDIDLSKEGGMEEYNQTLQELKVNQNLLRESMYATTASFKDITDAATAANVAFNDNNELVSMEGVSYNALVNKLAELKQQWRSTTDETERAQLGERINNINDQLKNMDKSVGVFGRNVGNYIGAVDHLAAGLSVMGKGAAGLVNPLKNATMGLKAMSTTPVVAILGLLANVLSKVIAELKATEEGTESVTGIMGVFSGVGDAVRVIFQGIGTVVGKLSEALVGLAKKLGLVGDKMRERQAIAKEEIRLAKQERQTIMDNADANLKVAELRAKAVDKEKYTAEERLNFLKAANEEERQIAERAKKQAEEEYNLVVRRNALTKSSAEDLKAEADAYVKMVDAQTNYNNRLRSNTQEQNRIRKEQNSEREKEERELLKSQQRQLELNKSYWEERLKHVEKGSFDEYSTRQAILEDEYELEKKKAMADIKDAEEKVRTLELIEAKYNQRRLDLADEYAEEQLNQERLHLQNEAAALRDGSAAQLEALVAVKEKELDIIRLIGKKESETQEEYRAREIAAEKAHNEAKKALLQKRLAMVSTYASGFSTLADNIADALESGTETSKEEAEKVKNLRIASATIEMLNGVVSAISTAQELGPVAGPIMAAINSASVIAAGVANINKIKQQQVSTSGASTTTAASVQAPSVQPQVQQVRYITGATEEDRLNRMAQDQRVYILSSDIEANNNQKRVQVRETTF